jgi:hypothetical protein
VIIILSLDAPKSILETEKTLKSLSSGPIYIYKKQKKTTKKQNNPKKTKKPKKTHWAVFFLKPGFFQPCLQGQPDVFDHVRQEFEVVQVAQRVHRVVQGAKERETGKRKNKT